MALSHKTFTFACSKIGYWSFEKLVKNKKKMALSHKTFTFACSKIGYCSFEKLVKNMLKQRSVNILHVLTSPFLLSRWCCCCSHLHVMLMISRNHSHFCAIFIISAHIGITYTRRVHTTNFLYTEILIPKSHDNRVKFSFDIVSTILMTWVDHLSYCFKQAWLGDYCIFAWQPIP